MEYWKDNFFIIALCITMVFGVPLVIKTMKPEATTSENIEQSQNVQESSIEEEPNIEDIPQNNEQFESVEQDTNTQEETVTSVTFKTVDTSYFDDALFIGDSRTVGLSEYSNLKNATYFCTSGMNVYGVTKEQVSIPSLGKLTLDELLQKKQFGKIYVMLGINELGYDFNKSANKYKELLEQVQLAQPNPVVYICANLYVSKSRSESDEIFNNQNIAKYNQKIKEFADGKDFFYLDVNELFDDGNGNLADNYTSDNAHVLGKYYVDWGDWLCQHGIVR